MKEGLVQTAEDTIIMDIEIAAPPERVFRALTDPRQLAAWWASDGRTVDWEMDLRVGGKWRSRGNDKSCGNYDLSGEIVELDPRRVLAYTWQERSSEQNVSGTLVRYELEPTAKGTRVHLTHSGVTDRKIFDDYRGGWPKVLGMLQQYLERQRVA